MTERPRYFIEIGNRIRGYEGGSVFSATDFLDIAGVDAVNKALSRMNEDGTVRRIIQGIYDIPEYSELLQEYSAPRIDKVAYALARKYNWTIAPSSDIAMNILHLSTQVPNQWEYISDGPYREYEIGNRNLKFKKRANKETSRMSYITIVVIQAIKGVGKENISNFEIEKLRMVLSQDEKTTLLQEGRTATEWVYETIKKICEG